MKTHLITAVAALLWSVSGATLAQAMTANPAPSSQPADASALYQALGEKSGITQLMDDFVNRLVADPRIADSFKNANLENLKRQLTEQICQVAGGPCQYRGADMASAHADMDIRKSHFNALVEDLQRAMDARSIPFSAQNQLLARLAPMHRDIISK
ncbi:group I truncated hemoglobin [Curvibacter cyanobacteriorum]